MTLGLITSNKTFFAESYTSNQATVNFSCQRKSPVCNVGKQQNWSLSSCLVVFESEGRGINLHIVHIIYSFLYHLTPLAGRETSSAGAP